MGGTEQGVIDLLNQENARRTGLRPAPTQDEIRENAALQAQRYHLTEQLRRELYAVLNEAQAGSPTSDRLQLIPFGI